MSLVSKSEIIAEISSELSIPEFKVTNTIGLLEEGNTVPFISRYRKERTGNLTEIDIRDIQHWWQQLNNLYDYKASVISTITEQGKMTEELHEAIMKTKTLSGVDDLYAPFKKKRKTKADIAIEQGLEPLALKILNLEDLDPESTAKEFFNDQVKDTFDAFKGAVEIIAEKIGHDIETKDKVKEEYISANVEVTVSDDTVKNDEKSVVFKDYFEYNEPISKLASHRLLAINRGEKEGILKLKIDIEDKDKVISDIKDKFKPKKASNAFETYYNRGFDLAYSKFLAPATKSEIWREKKEAAFKDAINVFTKNLESLLLTPPISGYTIFGIDPGFRTGCKIAIISPFGKVLHTGVLYFTTSGKEDEAVMQFEMLLEEYKVTLISIGDGTASRETEELVANSEVRQKMNIPYMIVTEAGASIYSASELASIEFPELDVSLRGTISIARRVQDPLAEYVKIDPWSIGVGQYQHDVPQTELKQALSEVVESVVNRVGVEVNNASPQLLSYVSGISLSQAKAIHTHVIANGPLTAREQILSIKGIGEKTYEQAAGFLRISNSINPLDATGIHPESYKLTEEILEKVGFPLADLAQSKRRNDLKIKLELIDLEKLRKSLSNDIGEFTFADIIDGLKAPFRDPRESLEKPLLRNKTTSMDTLQVDQIIEGVVKNVTNFGAFVDIGLKESGLVHISELSNTFVSDPFEIVKPGDRVKVKIISLDTTRGRIGLSMKQVSAPFKSQKSTEQKNYSQPRKEIKRKEPESFKKLTESGNQKFSLNDLQKRFR